jgi:hypothetical protein
MFLIEIFKQIIILFHFGANAAIKLPRKLFAPQPRKSSPTEAPEATSGVARYATSTPWCQTGERRLFV